MYPLVCHALMLCFNDKTGDSKAINAQRTLCDRRTVAQPEILAGGGLESTLKRRWMHSTNYEVAMHA